MHCYDSNITHKKWKSLNYFISLVLILSSYTYWIVFWGNASYTKRLVCIQMAGANRANTYLWSLIFLQKQAVISNVSAWYRYDLQHAQPPPQSIPSSSLQYWNQVIQYLPPTIKSLGYKIKRLKPPQFLLYHSYSHTICLNQELNYYKNT
jgi:hypothetical protein